MEKSVKQIDKLIEDYEYLKELVESKSMVSQLSESTQGYLLEYFGIRNTEDLSDKCDELEKEIETNKCLTKEHKVLFHTQKNKYVVEEWNKQFEEWERDELIDEIIYLWKQNEIDGYKEIKSLFL